MGDIKVIELVTHEYVQVTCVHGVKYVEHVKRATCHVK